MTKLKKAIAYFEDAIRESDEIIAECSEELQKQLTEQKEHFVVALDAMWRNIPAPVVKAGIYGVGESCPHCKSEVKGMYFYCTVCGQKLNWEGEGEKIARNMFDTIEALQQEIETLTTARAEQAEQINRLTIAFYNALMRSKAD